MIFTLLRISVFHCDNDDRHEIMHRSFDSKESLKEYMLTLTNFNDPTLVDKMIDSKQHITIKTNRINHYFILDASDKNEFNFCIENLDNSPIDNLYGKNIVEIDVIGYVNIFKAWTDGVYSADIYDMIVDWINDNIDKCNIHVRKYLKEIEKRMQTNESSGDIAESFISKDILKLRHLV